MMLSAVEFKEPETPMIMQILNNWVDHNQSGGLPRAAIKQYDIVNKENIKAIKIWSSEKALEARIAILDIGYFQVWV